MEVGDTVKMAGRRDSGLAAARQWLGLLVRVVAQYEAEQQAGHHDVAKA